MELCSIRMDIKNPDVQRYSAYELTPENYVRRSLRITPDAKRQRSKELEDSLSALRSSEGEDPLHPRSGCVGSS